MKNAKSVQNTRKIGVFEKFPAGHYELKISCDQSVTRSGGFSCYDGKFSKGDPPSKKRDYCCKIHI